MTTKTDAAEQSGRLLDALRSAALADALLSRDDSDVVDLAALSDESLRVYVEMLADTTERRSGHVPIGDTAAIHCARCGPVWIHPDIAAVLPVVGAWPRALGCPWCFVRKAGGYIPRPLVTCDGCGNLIPDTINPPAGMGSCGAGGGTHWPMQKHRCAAFSISTEKRDLA